MTPSMLLLWKTTARRSSCAAAVSCTLGLYGGALLAAIGVVPEGCVA